MLLLHRAPGVALTPRDVAEKLRIPDLSVERGLEALVTAELLTAAGEGRARTYAYAPRRAALLAPMDRLASIYLSERLPVMRLISAYSMERMRSAAARAFADSFLLGRRPTDG